MSRYMKGSARTPGCWSRAVCRLRLLKDRIVRWALDTELEEEEEEEEEDREDREQQNIFSLEFEDRSVEAAYRKKQDDHRISLSTVVVATRAVSVVCANLLRNLSPRSQFLNTISALHVAVFTSSAVFFIGCKELVRHTPSKKMVAVFTTTVSVCICADLFIDSLQSSAAGEYNLFFSGIVACGPAMMRFSWLHHMAFFGSSITGILAGSWISTESSSGMSPLIDMLPYLPFAAIACRRSEQYRREAFTQRRARNAAESKLRDVTGNSTAHDQIKILEQQVTAAVDQANKAEQSEKVQIKYVNCMAHELRGPLTAIMGSSELLLGSRTLGAADRQLAKLLHVSGKQMLDLVVDCIDLFKLMYNPDAFVLNNSAFNAGQIVQRLQEKFSVRANVKNTGLQFNMGALTASQYMYGDEKRIEQVISNLLSCALNMTEKGDMIICNMDARQSSVTGSDIRFRVKISDNGCGISPEDKRMLFVPFIKTRFGKAGNMGLAIANRLVQIMGDAPIDTESSVGVGTVFRLSMQLAGINMPGIPALGMPPHKTALARSNIRVLLVEDMPQIRMVIKRSLTSIGIGTVDTCTNGKEAVDLVCGDGAEKYDCLFMDYFMPEMDGIEATKQIRKLLGAEAAPPIVGLTGDDAKNTADRFLQAGATLVLVKPVKAARLLAVLEQNTGQETNQETCEQLP